MHSGGVGAVPWTAAPCLPLAVLPLPAPPTSSATPAAPDFLALSKIPRCAGKPGHQRLDLNAGSAPHQLHDLGQVLVFLKFQSHVHKMGNSGLFVMRAGQGPATLWGSSDAVALPPMPPTNRTPGGKLPAGTAGPPAGPGHSPYARPCANSQNDESGRCVHLGSWRLEGGRGRLEGPKA